MATRGTTLLALDHWHIEPSSVCTLKCPRCPRLEVADTLLNRQLTLDFFQHQIGEQTISIIKKITFCGNDGDPIYCRDFLDICSWIKTHNPSIQLTVITNGSYKPKAWWHDLGVILDHNDEVNWSLDGWNQASNSMYRVNCDWTSIIDGYRAFSQSNTSTYRVWAAIAFRFNQSHLPDMVSMARAMEFDCFQITKSTKFGSHYPEIYGSQDPLCPSDPNLISAGHRFEREIQNLSGRIRPGMVLKQLFWQRAQQIKQEGKYSGICLIGNKGVFLNSRGEFYPCCWTANRYPHNQQWAELAQKNFNLHQKSFTDIMADEFWNNDFLKFESIECHTKCTMDKLEDRDHTTEW